MFRIAPVAVIMLVAALAVGCGNDDEARPTLTLEPSLSATASVTPTSGPTVSPTASPGSVVLDGAAGRRVVFLRAAAPYPYWDMGELWIGGLDGSGRERLSPEGEAVKFAGLATDYATGNQTVSYVSRDGEYERSLWALDRVTGERSVVLTFEAFREDQADAWVSPDGRHVAYAHVGGVDLLDWETGVTQHLLDNGQRECLTFANCFMHTRPRWSPDGMLLTVKKTFYEGGTTVVVDPFSDPVQTYSDDSANGPSISEWSETGHELCGYGTYGGGGLLVAGSPSWVFADVTEGWVSACSWFDERFVAFGANVSRPHPDGGVVSQYSVEMRVFDREMLVDRLVSEDVGKGQISTGPVIALAGSSLVATQRFVDEAGDGSGKWTRPELIDVDTGERTLVLEEGDVLVAVAP